MRALISVSDKTGIVEFARGLVERGFELVSTGGTAKTLAAAGLDVAQVSDLTGAPEMMDGRVKTLHPFIFGGVLARRHHAGDQASLDRFNIRTIDLVCVNLYPFRETAANRSAPFDHVVENIDIGGPSLIRAAAKNMDDVLVVVSAVDYARVLHALDQPGGPTRELRLDLMRKAFAHTAAYDTAIASELESVSVGPEGYDRATAVPALPARMLLSSVKYRGLRYGENPHQEAAWYVPAEGALVPSVLQGKELSFTNLLDLDAACRIVSEFVEPAACVIKHTNPCGTATGVTVADAYVRAREADPLSAYGGIVGCNRPIDVETATAIASTFIEAVVAPAISDDALAILAAKKNLRVVVAPHLFVTDVVGRSSLEIRTAIGGWLVQQVDRVIEARDPWPGDGGLDVVTTRQPSEAEWQALRFAWRVCAHVKSNTILFAAADRSLAVGAGQMSRVDAVNVAVMKATGSNISLAGSVVASDAYFPFRDGLDAVANAGATAIVQPGGSVRDAEVIAAANERGLAMVFARRRHFRH